MSDLSPIANSRTITPKFWAAKNTYWDRVYGVPFDVYAPGPDQDNEGNEIPFRVNFVGSSIGLFLQIDAAPDQPTPAGIGLAQEVHLIYPAESHALIKQRHWLKDAPGHIWLVTSFPDRQRAGPGNPEIIGNIALVTLQVDKPPGMP